MASERRTRRQVMEMMEVPTNATVCDAAAMGEHRQGLLRPRDGRWSDRQATIGMDEADERARPISEMKHIYVTVTAATGHKFKRKTYFILHLRTVHVIHYSVNRKFKELHHRS